jgi:beta-lactam-binding protein with PASTA domain
MLAAIAASGSGFAGWSGGGCSGIGSCVVTINADTAVTATFTANPVTLPLTFVTNCVVPKLVGKTLGQAKFVLIAAHCKVGAIRKSKVRKGEKLGSLVVKFSSPAAGATLPADSKVNLKLGLKSKKKH